MDEDAPVLSEPTAEQQDKILQGQRNVNLIWETTQASIAIILVISYVAMILQKIEIPQTLDNLMFVVMTFYFARTNHTRIGGVGVTDFQRKFGSR